MIGTCPLIEIYLIISMLSLSRSCGFLAVHGRESISFCSLVAAAAAGTAAAAAALALGAVAVSTFKPRRHLESLHAPAKF